MHTSARWLEIASNPEIEAYEAEIQPLLAANDEQHTLSSELSDIYWCAGQPRTALVNGIGNDESRLSFVWDRQKEHGVRSKLSHLTGGLVGSRYINDRRIYMGSTIEVPGQRLHIRRKDDKYYLTDGHRVISQGFSSITPVEDQDFLVPSGNATDHLHVLDTQEQATALEKRIRYEALSDAYESRCERSRRLQDAIADMIFELYGIEREEEKSQRSNAAEHHFRLAGSYVYMKAFDTALEVRTFGEWLTAEQRFAVWKSFDEMEQEARLLKMEEGYKLHGIPDHLMPYEDKVRERFAVIQDERELYRALYPALCTDVGYRRFHISGSRISATLPVALELIQLPIPESYPMIGSVESLTDASLEVPHAGTFHSGYNDSPAHVWQIDTDGNIVKVG